MAISISTFLTRVKAQLEAISLESADNTPVAFTRALYSQNTYPYYTIETASVVPVKINAQLRRYDVTLNIYLHRGVVGEGYNLDGNIESLCQDDCFAVLEYYQQYRDLTTEALTSSIAGFVPGSDSIINRGVGALPNGEEIGSQYQLNFSINEFRT